jgi:ssDNA-binding Zn-finger/Zn-ribbon topoisomerase 1
MIIRFGKNGRFLACSTFPDHKESRPLPGEEPETPALGGVGEACPECGATDGGELVAKRGRFGPFVGCNRYPDCRYIRKEGPPPPDQLPFEVACPTCGEGHLVARRARRTGSVFWGCSRYPKCDFTTSREPLGPVHEPDDGPLARADDDTALCLRCGASVPLAGASLEPGSRIAGGEPNAAALARPAARRGGKGRQAAAARPRRAPAKRTGTARPT